MTSRWDRRLWRRRARAAEAVSGRPVGLPAPLPPWEECRAAWSRQVRPEEAQEPSWGAAACCQGLGASSLLCCGCSEAAKPSSDARSNAAGSG